MLLPLLPIKYEKLKFGDPRFTHMTPGRALYKIEKDQVKELFQDMVNGTIPRNVFLTERKSEYFIFFLDLDFKENNSVFSAFSQFWDIFIEELLNTLRSCFELSDEKLTYIYSNRNDTNRIKKKGKLSGIHLFFPYITINSEYAVAFRTRLISNITKDNKFIQLNEKHKFNLETIIDESVLKKTNLRLLGQTKGQYGNYYYKIDWSRSTIENPNDPMMEYRLTSLRSNATGINFKIRNDADGKGMLDDVIEKVDPVEEKRIITRQIIQRCIFGGFVTDLLDIIAFQYCHNREPWYQICFSLQNTGNGELAHEFSQRSPKYDFKAVERLLSDAHKYGYGVGTICHFAKLSNSEEFSRIQEKHARKPLKYDCVDEFLLSENSGFDYEENECYISDKAVDWLLERVGNRGIIKLQANTGGGKTTTFKRLCNHFIQNKGCNNILCIVSRRSLGITQWKDLKILDLVLYLNKKSREFQKRYIISVEQVERHHRRKDPYEILILDEFTSLLRHIASQTVKDQFAALMAIGYFIINCRYVIVAGALLNDASNKFLEIVANKKILYYRNRFANRSGIPMRVYHFENHLGATYAQKIETICDNQLKNAVSAGKSVFIISDSKSVINKFGDVMEDWNSDEKYFLKYTSEKGNRRDFEDANEIWVGKCVMASPTLEYGFNNLVEYDEVWCVFECFTSTSESIVQQTSRARCSKSFNMVVLKTNYLERVNYVIDRDIHYRMVKELHDHNSAKMIDLQNSLDFDMLDMIMNKYPDYNSEMADLLRKAYWEYTLRQSYIDKCTSRNKMQLALDIFREQGYDVSLHPVTNIKMKKCVSLKTIQEKYTQELNEEMQKCLELVYHGILPDESVTINDTSIEKIEIRIQNLGITRKEIKKNPWLKDMICDGKEFDMAMQAAYLFKSQYSAQRELVQEFTFKMGYTENIKLLVYQRLDLAHWLETKMGINRFDLNSAKVDDIPRVIAELKELETPWISGVKRDRGKFYNKLICCISRAKNTNIQYDRMCTQLDKIHSLNGLKKLLTDVYNTFGKLFEFKYNKKKKIYSDFKTTSLFLDYKFLF